MRKRFAQNAWGVLGLNLLVILWGAFVRASKSGEGCGDHWPLCNGTVLPHAAKIATLIEFTHRASTGLALISVVVMAVWAVRAFPRGPVRQAAIASGLFIFTEAMLGAGLVLFGYVGQNVSIGRAIYLSAHLINTMLMLGAIALTAWWGSGRPSVRWIGNVKTVTLLGLAVAGALVLAVSGAITALGDTLFPVTSLRAGWEADLSSTSHLFIRLRIWHPVIAVLAGGYIAIVANMIGRAVSPAGRLASAVVALVAVQLAAGMVNLWLLAPVWMQLLHLLLADLLWVALILFSAAALQSGFSHSLNFEYPQPFSAPAEGTKLRQFRL